MNRVILLDTHPLSKVTHPKLDPIQQWLLCLQETETIIRVPEIADYELRRELLRGLRRDNEMVLECAINAQASAIVTFNERDFLPAAQQFGIEVIQPGVLVRSLNLRERFSQ